jgi:hypothetical protein
MTKKLMVRSTSFELLQGTYMGGGVDNMSVQGGYREACKSLKDGEVRSGVCPFGNKAEYIDRPGINVGEEHGIVGYAHASWY